jgi:hypothetical protein
MILLDTGAHPGLLNKILQGDYWLFSRINQGWTCPFLDTVLLFAREAEFWIPFYLFLLVFATLNFGKKGWIWSLYLVMTVIISDLISSHLIKDHLVYRLRPCGNPLWADSMRFLANYCPSSSSFTSSHACNHFAMAVFIFQTVRQNQSLVVACFRLGICDFLCTGICRCPLSAGCFLRRNPGLADRLVGQQSIPDASRYAPFTTQYPLPCLKWSSLFF